MAEKKEKKEIVIPELEGAALVLKNGLSYEVASSRLNQIEGLKFELKEYKRTKDVKIKIAKTPKNYSGSLSFTEVNEEKNSYKDMEDATYGLLSHLGYTLEMESRYQKALSDGKNAPSTQIVYSKKPEESMLGLVGIPIRREAVPALSFDQMLEYENISNKKEVKFAFAGKTLSHFLDRGNEIATKAIVQFNIDRENEEKAMREKEKEKEALEMSSSSENGKKVRAKKKI